MRIADFFLDIFNPAMPHHPHPLAEIPHNLQHMPMYHHDIEPQYLRNGFLTNQTTPDNIPMTPIMPHMPGMDNFVSMNFDHDGDQQFLNMNNAPNMFDFDPSGILAEFTTPPSLVHDVHDQYLLGKSVAPTPSASVNFHHSDGSTCNRPRTMDMESPTQPNARKPSAAPSSAPSSAVSSTPTLCTTKGLQEPEAVIAAHQAWPYFQCNRAEKPSFSPPKTASIYLEGLAQTLRNQDTWQTWTTQLDERILDCSTNIMTEPMFGSSREKLLAIAQTFLHKALDIHKAAHGSREDSPASPVSSQFTFLMLPPPEAMQYFFKSYVARYEPYYSSIPGGRFNPNAIMQSNNSKAASLLVLLMLASGSTATSTVEARYLTSGLTEACRISLFDLIEKDVMQSREPVVLRSALLFTTLAAWSGDKWHMDIAMGQRGMYLAMLGHAGMLEASSARPDLSECREDPEKAWEEWKEREGRNRLAHSWVLVDQEMSLFSDTTPLLSVDNLFAAMPDSEELWQAPSAGDWLSAMELAQCSWPPPSSARDLFARFVEGEILASEGLSATQLRLLLHPLQALVCQLRQFIACFSDLGNHAKASRAVSRAATKARLEEVSALLQQWYVLSKDSFVHNKQQPCWTACTNLMIYHLISLNVVTSFKTIEQFARKEIVPGPFRQASWLRSRCIDNVEETFFHCGQVLRLIKSMPSQVRPPWWAGAVYRVALTGWANSIAAAQFTGSSQSCDTEKFFPIDNLTPEHESVNRYLKYQEGKPMLSKPGGSLLSLDVPTHILNHCIDILQDDCSMRLADGIKRKLSTFLMCWKET